MCAHLPLVPFEGPPNTCCSCGWRGRFASDQKAVWSVLKATWRLQACALQRPGWIWSALTARSQGAELTSLSYRLSLDTNTLWLLARKTTFTSESLYGFLCTFFIFLFFSVSMRKSAPRRVYSYCWTTPNHLINEMWSLGWKIQLIQRSGSCTGCSHLCEQSPWRWVSVGSKNGNELNTSSGLPGRAGWEGISAGDGVMEGGNRSLISSISSGIWLLASIGGLRSKAWCNLLLPARDTSLFINV